MREILFRGQTRRYGEKVLMNGEKVPSRWVYGGVLQGCGAHSIIYGGENADKPGEGLDKWPVYTDTLGQYTGLTDKNGKKIFEGDVVICSLIGGNVYHPPYSWNRKQVVFERGAFCVEDLCGDTAPLHDYAPGFEIEVIGNIHDNPGLREV